MTATAHMAVSAVLGSSSLPSWAAAPLSFLLHYILDLAPHVDEAELFEDGRPKSALAAFLLGLDLGFGLALTLPEIRRLKGKRALKAALCIVLGLLPDLLENIPATKGRLCRIGLYAEGEALHRRLQERKWAGPVGVLDQVALVSLALKALSLRGGRAQ